MSESLELGFASDPLDDQYDGYSDCIGGVPTSLQGTRHFPAILTICGVCEKVMHLLLQLNCPISSNDERRIYILACNSKTCSKQPKGYKAIRAILSKHKIVESLAEKSSIEPIKEVVERIEESKDLEGLEDEFDALLKLRAEKMSKNVKEKPVVKAIPEQPAQDTPSPKCGWFPGFYVEFETAKKVEVDMKHEMSLLKQYEREFGTVKGGEEEWESEKYEKERPKFWNKMFQSFQDECHKSPEQCIRYQPGGIPLFIAKDESFKTITNNPKPCFHCKGSCSFEFQLMPHLLSILPLDKHVDVVTKKVTDFVTMEWGTLIVYTCNSNCNQSPIAKGDGVAYFVENLYPQDEPN